MRITLQIAFCIALLGSVVTAQNKIESKWHCDKGTTQHSLDVGDMPGHTYMIQQGTCTNNASDSSLPEKTGMYTEFDENKKSGYTGHGRFNTTMADGDKVYYTYETSGPADMSKPANNKWKIVNGTGKQKGITGSGTCSGMRNKDESSDWTCTGTYTVPK